MVLRPLMMLTTLVACTGEQPQPDTGADGGEDTSPSDSAIEEEEPVWEDLRLETSATLTSAFASGTGLFAVTDGGESWLRQSGAWVALDIDVDDEPLNGIWGTGTDSSVSLVAVGDAGMISTFGSGSWQTEDIGTPNFEDIAGNSPTDLIAVGWGGVYANATGSWTFSQIDGNPRFNAIWYSGAGGFAVGEDGAIGALRAGTWTVSEQASRLRLYDVHGTAPTDVWAVGERGLVLHFDGTMWTEVDVGTNISLWSVYAVNATTVYVVGNNGLALRYDGTDWVSLPTGVENNLYDITVAATGVVWAVGNRGMAVRFTP